MRTSLTVVTVSTLLASLLSARSALAAQPPPQAPSPSVATQGGTAQPSGDTPESLAQIKAVLSHPAPVKLAGDRLRFYLEVYGRPTPFWSFVGSYDLRNGPVKRSPPTGQEFLDMMRPQLLYSSAGITAPELMQFALTNIAAQALIRKAVRDIRAAHTEAEVKQIRARIERELEALKNGGSQ
jgi:hypothetical protein